MFLKKLIIDGSRGVGLYSQPLRNPRKADTIWGFCVKATK